MSLHFTSPNGFRFFTFMVMITVAILALAKSLVDQIPQISPILRFGIINLFGFILFIFSLIRGKKVSNDKQQWFNNAFLVAGVVLITYAGTVEVVGAIHSVYLPVFYIVEIIILLLIGNRMKMEDGRTQYEQMLEFQHSRIKT